MALRRVACGRPLLRGFLDPGGKETARQSVHWHSGSFETIQIFIYIND